MRQNIEYGKDVEVPLLEFRGGGFRGWGKNL